MTYMGIAQEVLKEGLIKLVAQEPLGLTLLTLLRLQSPLVLTLLGFLI